MSSLFQKFKIFEKWALFLKKSAKMTLKKASVAHPRQNQI